METKTPECDVKGKLDAIMTEQIARLMASGSLSHAKVEESMNQLRMQRLLPNQIESDICKELKNICQLKYETAIPGSKRMNGFGWSEEHMKSHMKKLMKSKLAATATVLRIACSSKE